VFSVVTENGHIVTLRLDHSFPPAPVLGVCILTFSSAGLWQSVPPARVTYIRARVAHMFSGLENRFLSAIFFGRVRMDCAPLGESRADRQEWNYERETRLAPLSLPWTKWPTRVDSGGSMKDPAKQPAPISWTTALCRTRRRALAKRWREHSELAL